VPDDAATAAGGDRSWMSRSGRWIGIDRNPLRRRTDRIEAWLRVVLTAVVLTCAPFVVWWSGSSAYDQAAAAADWHGNRLVPVQAVLLQDADHPTQTYDGNGTSPVQARWTAPNGVVRTGPVVPPAMAPKVARAGTTILILTDEDGSPVHRTAPNPSASATGVGLASAALIAAVYAAVLLAVRRLLDRRRMADWQDGWRHVEPRWSGRR
jgi:hypothetical protein